MDTRYIIAMVGVARYGSFTGASRVLHVSQSTLSRQVASLERALGAQVFIRRGRTVSLTPIGEAFLPRGLAILEAVEAAFNVTGKGGLAAHEISVWRTSTSPESMPSGIDSPHGRSGREAALPE
jgi:DNA-binding transcriptional LysR family regulator